MNQDTTISPEAFFLRALFGQLKRHHIDYCVLRNYQPLPDDLGGSDLDVLVNDSHVQAFYDILKDVTLQSNGLILINYGERTPKVCVSGKCEKWWGVQIDIHEGILPFKLFPTLDVDFILKRANLHNDIRVADDNDAAMIAFLKEILNNGTCKEAYFESARNAFQQNENIYKALIDKYLGHPFFVQLKTLFNDDVSKQKLFEIAVFGRKILFGGWGGRLKLWKENWKKVYRFFSPPGFTLAVLGCDGSGKTTVINGITSPLANAFHNSVYYEHMRPNLIPNIAQLFGKKAPKGPTVNPHGSKPSGLIGSLVRLLYYSFDYICGYWLKVYPVTVKKSCIWIFDRYYYDYMIDPTRSRIALPKWVPRFIRLFVPEPDLIVCLGADPDIVHARKPELSIDEVKKQHAELKRFSQTNARAVWIDTGCSIEESVDQAMQTITKRIAKRYEK